MKRTIISTMNGFFNGADIDVRKVCGRANSMQNKMPPWCNIFMSGTSGWLTRKWIIWN